MALNGDVLVWIDLEMDGLDLSKNFILEIACIVTDFSLTETREGPDIVVRHPRSLLNAMGQWCTTHHTASGLYQQVLDSRHTMSDAENQIIDFLQQVTQRSARLFLAGNSVYIDRYFLEKDMPRLNSRLDPIILDCSVLKELIRRFNSSVAQRTPIKFGQLHRALDDIRNSIVEFRYYQQNGFQEKINYEQKTWPKLRDVNDYLLWIEINSKIHCILTDGNLNVLGEISDGKTSNDVIRFLQRNHVRHSRTVPLAGRSLGSLRSQLHKIARELNEHCHYRSVDVDVVSLVCEKYFPAVYRQRPMSSNSLMDLIELLRFYRAAIFKTEH